MSTPPFLAGAMVTSNVRLIEPLGEGGMGTVWLAEHTTLHTRVAVKFVTGRLLQRDPRVLARFQREACIAANIRSPHSVQIFDHGFMGGDTPFIVMELLEGETLAARIERERLSLEDALLLLRQVGEVLEAAHQRGVVHRDIKPDNLFLIRSGYELFVKVLDFGVAKQTCLDAAHMTSTGALIGTPAYMSPELVDCAKSATPHADMWALAVVAYQALTGVYPFWGETWGALLLAITSADAKAPSSHRADLPPIIDAWFARALAHDANDRFASVREMVEAFAQAVSEADELAVGSTQTSPDVVTSPSLSTLESGTQPTLDGATSTAIPMATTSPLWRWGWALLAIATIFGTAMIVGGGTWPSERVAVRASATRVASSPLTLEAVPPAPAPVVEPATETSQPKKPRVLPRPRASARPTPKLCIYWDAVEKIERTRPCSPAR